MVRSGSRGKSTAVAMAGTILAVNAAGWSLYLFVVMTHHFRYQHLGVGIGVAFTAWTLGMRHAFDADHISAIDNTTRKLMAEGRQPLAAGYFFALGHSTVVMVVGVAIAFAARAVFGAVVDPRSTFESLGGTVGTSLAGIFLYLIAAMNLVVLGGIWRLFRRSGSDSLGGEAMERQLAARGFMGRYFRRLSGRIHHSWQMAPVGFVFGIGFDTATEVLLLSATAYAATSGLPFYAVLALPLLFSGGMLLLDTADGVFMNFAYGWAFARPVRKLYYNLVVTGLSVTAAFLVGTVELLGVLTSRLDLHGRFWSFVGSFNVNRAGFVIVGLFVVVWAGAIAIWKFRRIEERWSTLAGTAPLAQSGESEMTTVDLATDRV